MGWSLTHDEIAAAADGCGFSGQVVVRRGDDTVYSGCFGLAERAHRAPVTDRTRFGVASFTKMFTACVVAGLVSEGRFEFGTPLAELLSDEVRPAWLPADVTVRHALSHTSGISDYLEEDEHEGDTDMFARVLAGRAMDGLREVTDFLPLMERVRVRPAPAPLAYSSTGFILLGLAAEQVTGHGYRALVEERVLDPLGIGPAFPALDEVWSDVAVGYLPPHAPGAPARTNVFSLPPVGGPDGGAYLTATEMVTFLRAYAQDLVVPGLRDTLLERVAVDEDDDAYGYGVWILGHGAERRFGHSGFDPGFECHGWHWPTTDTTFAITSNVNEKISVIRDLVVEAVQSLVTVEIRPASVDRFDDVATMLGPKNPTSSVCWCLSHRIDSRTNQSLVGPARGDYVRELCRRPVAPGVLAYDGEEVVGWAAVAPRADLPFARSRKIPHVDDLPVWSVWCVRVRPGHRGRGIAVPLLEGAVDYAAAHDAPAVEGYPVDNDGAKVDLTMAYVGTRSLFERAGFTKAADTAAVSGGFPRVLMRRDLRG